MEFETVIKKRASIKKYSPKKFDITKVIEIIESANLAPSPGNLSILRYIIVEEPKLKIDIASACLQPFVSKAQFLIIICSDIKNAKLMFEGRAERYVRQHAGAAIENMLLKITDMGFASCWIGAYSEDMLRDILNIPENIFIEAILPVSYQDKLDSTVQKRKYSLDGKIFFESYKNKYKSGHIKIRREDI